MFFFYLFDDWSAVLFQVLFCGDLNEFKKPSETPVTVRKNPVKSVKSVQNAAPKRTSKKSAANSCADSVTSLEQRVPVKRARAAVAADENARDTAKGAHLATSCAAERGKRRSKRHHRRGATLK